MKVNYLEKELSPIGILLENSLSAVAERVKEFLTRARVREDKLSDWQLILLQSKAYGCSCRDEDLPQKNWQWPQNTWFQERLSHHLRICNSPRRERGAASEALEPASQIEGIRHS
jgi:hypothetical protein